MESLRFVQKVSASCGLQALVAASSSLEGSETREADVISIPLPAGCGYDLVDRLPVALTPGTTCVSDCTSQTRRKEHMPRMSTDR